MNKYYVKIPYSYTQYADLSGFVFAESSEEAKELAADDWNILDPEHNNNDSSDLLKNINLFHKSGSFLIF